MLRNRLPSHHNPSSFAATSNDIPSSDLDDEQHQQRRRQRRHRDYTTLSTTQSFTSSNDYYDENVEYMNDDENVNVHSHRKPIPSSTQTNNEETIFVTSSIPAETYGFTPPSVPSSASPPPSIKETNQNELFEGFCIDVLRLIAKMVGFEYSIKLVPDGKYGVYDLETGEWNGIVRELMDKVSNDN